VNWGGGNGERNPQEKKSAGGREKCGAKALGLKTNWKKTKEGAGASCAEERRGFHPHWRMNTQGQRNKRSPSGHKESRETEVGVVRTKDQLVNDEESTHGLSRKIQEESGITESGRLTKNVREKTGIVRKRGV